MNKNRLGWYIFLQSAEDSREGVRLNEDAFAFGKELYP